MGIRDKPIAPASPWQNGFVERLIGSIRRECVDHIIVLGEAHLRRILKSYTRYYNETRTHLALDKDAPVSRPVQRTGVVRSLAILGGLHHKDPRSSVYPRDAPASLISCRDAGSFWAGDTLSPALFWIDRWFRVQQTALRENWLSEHAHAVDRHAQR